MSNKENQKVSIERIALIIVSILLIIAVAYIAFTSLLKGKDEPDTVSTVPPDQAPLVEPTTEQIGEVEVTPTPRRLPEVASPTPHEVSEDDVRAMLDLTQPDFFDYFNDPDTWYDYDSEGWAAYRIEDGHLIGKDYEPEEKYVYWSFTNPKSGNVYAEITATNGDCIGKDSVGLVIRVQADETPSGYALEVSCDGSWRFRLHRGNLVTKELIKWTPSEVINTGPFVHNRLSIWGYKGKFHLFINDYEISEYFDSQYYYTYGYFAAYVRASRTFELEATFDDFAFWHIPFIP
jgi:hypothetical protein